jgi:branched-chain amino acid transport system ATP-binding protein
MADTILELEDVVAGYGEMTILNQTSFGVRRGAITTVIGPNGSGKSTVFKAVFGLLKLRSGTIRFHGAVISGLSPRTLLERGICYVPQGRNIFPELSVRHNLELGLVAAGRGVDVGATVAAALARFPVLASRAGRQASTLSGGEQKLLEIARGLLLEPKLLLIDEPSIGLSPRMVGETFELLKQLRDQGITVLMIEQNARSALALSDFAVVLELGRAQIVDTAHAVLNNKQVGQLFLGGSMEAPAAC